MDQIKALRQEIKTLQSQEGLDQKSMFEALLRLTANVDKLLEDEDKKESKTKIEDDKRIIDLLDSEPKDIGNVTQKCEKVELKFGISSIDSHRHSLTIKGSINMTAVCQIHTKPYTHTRFYMSKNVYHVKEFTAMDYRFTYFGINNVVLYNRQIGRTIDFNLQIGDIDGLILWTYRQILKLCIDNKITDPIANDNCTFAISSQPTVGIWDVVLKPDHKVEIEMDSRFTSRLAIAPRIAFNEHLEKITQELVYDGKTLYTRAEFAALVAKYIAPGFAHLCATTLSTKVAHIDIYATHPNWQMYVRVRTQQMESELITSMKQ